MTYDSTLTIKGQVTIPATIRRSLGLKAGEAVRFRVTDSNQVLIEKNDWKEELNDLHRQVATQLKTNSTRPLSDRQLDKAINEEAAETVLKEWQQGQEQ
jgi:AbrB family looped-hinge helix DNA binding protein